MRKLHRSRTDRKLGGVCGGLGERFKIDPVLFRIVFVLFALGGFGTGVLVYFLLWWLVPEGPSSDDVNT